MTDNAENLIAAVIDDAEEMQDTVVDTAQSHKPRLLIENCHESEIQRRVVGSLAKVCKELGIRVVAEGIEREEERDAAVALGCDYLQGFLFGRPQAA